VFSVHAHADHPGGLVGVNRNGMPLISFPVQVGGYQIYAGSDFATAGDVIRVWMYAPATPGFVVIDDVSLLVESFSINPASVAFGNQMVNTSSATRAVILTNSGSTPQPVSARIINFTNFADFGQTNDCPSNLAVGASCTFSISFTPSATGARSGALVVDGLIEQAVFVDLTGTGTN